MPVIQKVVTEAPYWRTANADQFANQLKVRNATPAATSSGIPQTTLCRASWKYPQCVTIYSAMTPLIDPTKAAFHNIVHSALARLRVEFGDNGKTFTRDVLVGVPLEVNASFVNVRAYIAPLTNLTNTTLPFPVVPDSIETVVTAAVLEGGYADPTQGRETATECCDPAVPLVADTMIGPSFLHTLPFEAYGSVLLHSLTGFHAYGSDLYVQLFDYSAYHLDPSAPAVPNLSKPKYEFKVASGEDFSVTLDKGGVMFQHGLSPVFSSTPFRLTRVDATTIPFRANWRFSFPGLPAQMLIPRVLP
jgi:hypothetical protein